MLQTKRTKYVIIPAILFIILGAGVFSQTWTPVTGVSSYVNKIVFIDNNPNKFIVCSDNIPTDYNQFNIEFPNFGFGNNGYKITLNGGNSFSTEILKGYSVYDIIQLKNPSSTYLASVRKNSRGAVIISTNSGDSWAEDSKGCDESWQILNFVENKDNNVIFGAAVNTGEGLRYSSDNFVNCNYFKNIDISTRSIAVSPFDKNLIFVAGDDQYQRGVLRSYNNGVSWYKDSSGLKNLRILSIYASKYDKAVLYCGADSLNSYKMSIGKGIYQSLDTGKTWHRIGADGARIFQIVEHPSNPKFLAAAGDSTGVWISGSYGWEWENYSNGLTPMSAPIRTIAISPEDVNSSGIIIYAGTFGGGLFKSNRVKTDIAEDNNSTIEIFPNPAQNVINIKLNNSSVESQIKIYNQLGVEVVFKIIDQRNIDISNLSSGIYYLKYGNIIEKFVKY